MILGSTPLHMAIGSASSADPWWVTPLATVLGVLLAQGVTLWIYFRNRQNDAERRGQEEQQRWNREMQELCGKFSAECLRLQHALPLAEEADGELRRVELEALMAEIEIVAPHSVMKATQGLWAVATYALGGSAEARNQLYEARMAYVEKIRQELAIPRLWHADYSSSLPRMDR